MTKLQLSGTAIECYGLDPSRERSVVRLNQPDRSSAVSPFDFAVVRTIEELGRALLHNWRSVLGLGDELAPLLAEGTERSIVLPKHFDYLVPGDVIGIQHASKRFRSLYRHGSKHNSFLVTERCNNYCLMCSQPPKSVDDSWILDEISESLPLLDKELPALTFTGGEPLTNWRRFVEVMAECRDQLPNTAVQVLTNGRAFADSQIVDAWSSTRHPNLIAAIPVYSAVDHIHDHVVQARGAFDETLLGILKLKDRRQRVEIRIVLHALTAPAIAQTCRWLSRNFPFVDHVAIMGMENTGFALANEALLWIDPMDYRTELTEAVELLTAARINVSIYNLPRCTLDRTIWPFAVQSISDWKNGYVEVCGSCSERARCGGFFTSGRTRFSRGVRAIA
ncbi:His-Xaa-Ser system radical SAM maturase HxsC [Bradyrhizobium sp. DASA03005]|uniref:His-Xaa-Ser system radical SAM maturase HxsC n=1 Tax=Bradyrhizobium sp. SPXBL-02 TaxID=3395912 RepID=UPI003F705977